MDSKSPRKTKSLSAKTVSTASSPRSSPRSTPRSSPRSSPASIVSTDSSLKQQMDSAEMSGKCLRKNSHCKKTYMGLDWQESPSKSKSAAKLSPSPAKPSPSPAKLSSAAKTPSPAEKTPSPGPKLPPELLEIIADKANADTKRTMKEVNKDFKDYIKVSPTSGRKAGDKLLTWIKKNKSDRHTYDYHLEDSYNYPKDIIRITTEPQKFDEGKQILIWRLRPNEMKDLLAKYKYKGLESEVFKNIKLSDIIKKQKQTYFNKYLHTIIE